MNEGLLLVLVLTHVAAYQVGRRLAEARATTLRARIGLLEQERDER